MYVCPDCGQVEHWDHLLEAPPCPFCAAVGDVAQMYWVNHLSEVEAVNEVEGYDDTQSE